jgi:hypothetical protein
MSDVNQDEYIADLEVISRALRAVVRCVMSVEAMAATKDERVIDARRDTLREQVLEAVEFIEKLEAHLGAAKATAGLTEPERNALLARLGVSDDEGEDDDD